VEDQTWQWLGGDQQERICEAKQSNTNKSGPHRFVYKNLFYRCVARLLFFLSLCTTFGGQEDEEVEDEEEKALWCGNNVKFAGVCQA
jgi:hypothetical protein